LHNSLENLVVGSVEQQGHLSPTEFLSRISDHISGPITAVAARELGPALPAPTYFVELLLLIEDKRFIVHLGIDLVAIIRALIFNACGFSLQGASTIPQQLYMLSAHPRTLRFKIEQSVGLFGSP
jgi:membrane peptidoglycan carboxypeptidase